MLQSKGARIHRKGPAQPNMNAFAERFVQSIQQEALDHFVVLGEKHLNHLVSEYLVHYHEERPHQGIGNVPQLIVNLPPPSASGEITCQERLGGLLKHYHRQAA